MPRSRSISIQSERRPALALRLDLARKLDRAAEQQQLLGERGLARVRMRDDREGPAARDLGGERVVERVHGARLSSGTLL
jgi:hypothetical protein